MVGIIGSSNKYVVFWHYHLPPMMETLIDGSDFLTISYPITLNDNKDQ